MRRSPQQMLSNSLAGVDFKVDLIGISTEILKRREMMQLRPDRRRRRQLDFSTSLGSNGASGVVVVVALKIAL